MTPIPLERIIDLKNDITVLQHRVRSYQISIDAMQKTLTREISYIPLEELPLFLGHDADIDKFIMHRLKN